MGFSNGEDHQGLIRPSRSQHWPSGERQATGSLSMYTVLFMGRQHGSLPLCKGLIEMTINIIFLPRILVSRGSKSNLLGHASPPFSSYFLICPSVTGRPLLMMCNSGTLQPSLANLTTVWWSCPLQRFIGWWILPRWERFCVSDLSSK